MTQADSHTTQRCMGNWPSLSEWCLLETAHGLHGIMLVLLWAEWGFPASGPGATQLSLTLCRASLAQVKRRVSQDVNTLMPTLKGAEDIRNS